MSRPLLRAGRQSHALQRRLDAVAPVTCLCAPQRQRVLDVLEHAHVANQIEALKDQPDVDVARPRARRRYKLVSSRPC